MSPDEFAAWYERMGYRRPEEAAVALGCSAQTIKLYLRGRRYDRDARPVMIPERVARTAKELEKGP